MAGVVIDDTIRGVRVETSVPEGATVAEWITKLVRELGLPEHGLDEGGRWRRRKGKLIAYELLVAGDPDPLDDRQLLSADDLGPEPRLQLLSVEGTSAWTEMKGLVADAEQELGFQSAELAKTLRNEANDELTARLTALRLTAEAEAKQRIRGVFDPKPLLGALQGHIRAWRGRRAADAILRRIDSTGAAPDAVAGARLGVNQIATLAAQAMRVVPVAAAVVGTAAATTVVGAVYDDDLTEDDVRMAIEAELDERAAANGEGEDPIGGGDGGQDGPGGEPSSVPEATTFTFTDEIRTEIDSLLDPKFSSVQEAIEAIELPLERDQLARATLGGFDDESPTRTISTGASLWAIATGMRASPPTECEPVTELDESTAEYVSRIWAANVGAIGSDPDAIDPDATLVVPCPR